MAFFCQISLIFIDIVFFFSHILKSHFQFFKQLYYYSYYVSVFPNSNISQGMSPTFEFSAN